MQAQGGMGPYGDDRGECTLCQSIVGDIDSLKRRIGRSVD